jgi:hypothetical protein
VKVVWTTLQVAGVDLSALTWHAVPEAQQSVWQMTEAE